MAQILPYVKQQRQASKHNERTTYKKEERINTEEKKETKETRYLVSTSTAFAFAVLTMARLQHSASEII
jgi:hypothetical protein